MPGSLQWGRSFVANGQGVPNNSSFSLLPIFVKGQMHEFGTEAALGSNLSSAIAWSPFSESQLHQPHGAKVGIGM